MFDRVALKLKAKERLKGTWFPVPAATLFVYLVVATLLSSIANKQSTTMSIIAIILNFIVGASFNIAIAYFYIEYNKLPLGEKPKFNTFIDGFNFFVRGILGTLWMGLWLFLWTLCFIIPGIIKAFSYSMFLFILAENPNVSVRRALRISSEITKGYKLDIFITQLSFIGWYMLSVVTFGIILFWAVPYMYLTMANLYQFLKEEALRTGAVKIEDFN